MTIESANEAGFRRAAEPGSTSGFLRRAATATAYVCACLGIIGLAALAIGFKSFHDEIAAREPQTMPRADGIVVLTGGAQRVPDALALLSKGHGRKLLISGVHERTSRDELAKQAGGGRAILDCCVDLGKGARNTIGNAIETRRWTEANGFRSLIVVTSNYHMPRTLEEFRHALPGVRVTGYPVVTENAEPDRIWSDPQIFRLMASEYAKYVLARFRHIVETDPETSRWPVLVGRQKPVGPQPIERAGNSS